MTKILSLAPLAVPPPREAVLRAQGIPPDNRLSEPVEHLVRAAQDLYGELTDPRGMLEAISEEEFLDLYPGEGMNAQPAPLPGIVGQADALALFAATLGAPVSERIKELFDRNDPALGYMLDTIASERADAAAELLARHALDEWLETGGAPRGATALPYSPGYCGWHITGQKKLFARLNPGRIGIALNSSCLMLPIKSVSGVIVIGAREAHVFDNDFEFCLDCSTWECRARVASLS